ncbi:MAG: ribonuclease Y [Candidatus Pacebacteria bacterium]|nr:ribonuclease Y [Candidatus Paceibacterota bacterium]
MELIVVIIFIALAAIAGIALGYFLRWIISLGKKGSMELKIKQMMLEAKDVAQKVIDEAEKKSEDIIKESRSEVKERDEKIKKTEERLIKKEELLDGRQSDIDKESERIKQEAENLESLKGEAQSLVDKRAEELQKLSGLTEEQAKEALLQSVEKNSSDDILVRMQKLEQEGEDRLEKKAQEILTSSIQRLANNVTSDIMATSVDIPSDEIKGKIIGKEGRNIKSFEKSTGVEVIVDDTPGAVTISSFDPVRRQVARVALENLISDGRIQPAKIEEEVKKAQAEVNKIIKEKGEQAAFECGVYNLDPRIVSILGRLYFRTSYGQNVLQHSIEMAHVAGMVAEEIGADVSVAKAGALVHDIGKAIDHEVAGTHVEIGRRILQKFGADERIIKAMQAHHEEHPYETLESRIVQTADAISGARPGARRDTVENYIKRLAELEAIANSFEGVEKSYAIQAGREIRIFVEPDKVDDLKARKIARDIATRIENELKYPGEIKINVIRENRVTEYAR